MQQTEQSRKLADFIVDNSTDSDLLLLEQLKQIALLKQ